MKNFISNLFRKKKKTPPADTAGPQLPKDRLPDGESSVEAVRQTSPAGDSKDRPPRPKRRRIRRKGKAPGLRPGPTQDPPWDASGFQVPAVEGKTRFHDLNLPDPLLHAISDLGFQYCTPIQAEILPSTLAGKDASGRAQTGTGKTAAFLITVITRILNTPVEGVEKPAEPRVLILAPTRELVLQISQEARELSKYCAVTVVSVFGGMDYENQKRQLSAGPVHIVVATPGRLLDFQRQRHISLKKVEVLIIDEADRMLDMGFIPDVRKIIYSTPKKDKRQTLLFSATLTEEVTRLASQWTRTPITVEIEPEQVAVETVDQVVYIVTAHQKFALLYNIIQKWNLKRVLVFCNRRDEVTRLSDRLTRYGINCSELSGDISQKNRTRRLEQFKLGKIGVLVATDVAGRGIHIEGMDHVFNFSLPRNPEDYVHRIGRTGRAGETGTSISFADEDDSFYIPAIEEFIGHTLSCIEPEEEWLILPGPVSEGKRPAPRGRRKSAPASGRRTPSRSRQKRGRTRLKSSRG